MPNITDIFRQRFSRDATVIAHAPGRIEFIGNHTDYNGGAVLGAAIDRFVTVAAAPSTEGKFRLHSTGAHVPVELTSAAGMARLPANAAWARYPLGVWRALSDFNLPFPAGFDLLINSNLPTGAGLSSSAALELSSGLAMLKLANASLPPSRLAMVCRYAENNHVGVPCGVLDQCVCALGEAGRLVQIDCRGPTISRVPFPMGVHLWVFNTQEKHSLTDGLYAARHRECMDAAQALGVKWLTDLTPDQLSIVESGLPAQLAKRARHIVMEHARVTEVAAALNRGDLVTTGRLLSASHRSSRYLFENSTDTLDRLVETLGMHPSVLGARLTGGGVGGAVLALTRDTFTAIDAELIASKSGVFVEIFRLQTADGARLLDKVSE